MQFNSRGQSLVEYASIIILIMLGMVVGKIVVDRGAKAGIKNLTESVEESDLEIIKQDPGGVTLPECNCGLWQDGGCGNGPCADTERYEFRTCSPLGCEIQYGILVERCTVDNSCCTAPALVTGNPQTDCGINAANPPHSVPGGCPDDAGWATWNCGNLPPQFGCDYSFPVCYFRCRQSTKPACATECFPPPTAAPCIPASGCFHLGDNAGLTDFMDYTLVATSAECTSNPVKCKADCNNVLIPNPAGDDCICPDPQMLPGLTCDCICPPGSLWQGTCPFDACSDALCGAMQCRNNS